MYTVATCAFATKISCTCTSVFCIVCLYRIVLVLLCNFSLDLNLFIKMCEISVQCTDQAAAFAHEISLNTFRKFAHLERVLELSLRTILKYYSFTLLS